MPVEIVGTQKVIDRIGEIDKEIKNDVIQAVIGMQAIVVNGARNRVRKKTSALANSIQPGRIALLKNDIVGEVVATMPYASYVEYGTRPHFPPWKPKSDLEFPQALWIAEHGTTPHPFMEPALMENKRNYLRAIKKALRI